MRPPALLLAGVAAIALGCGQGRAPAGGDRGREHAAEDGHGHAAGDAAHAASDVRARAAPAPVSAVKLCEHAVPAELCTRCNPDLVPVFREAGDWCAEHGLPESHCRACNPALTFDLPATPKDWCKEHAVPESACTKCNPKLVARYVAAGDYCREHGFPESVCPRCHPERVRDAGEEAPVYPPPDLRVRLASDAALRGAGIETARAERRRAARFLEVVGRLDYDQNRLAQLSARGEALVVEVRVDVGDEVKRGQPLVVLTSASVGGSQAALQAAEAHLKSARSAHAREEELARRGVSARKDVESAARELAEAQAEHDAARAALDAAGAAGGSGGRYVLSAPFAGTVVARDAVAGRSAAPGQVLVEVADLTKMWARLDVPETEASRVRPGQRVSIALEAVPGARREGTVSRVGSAVDPVSRTVPVRVELANPDRALKAGMFLRASVALSGDEETVVVPRDAIQRAEGQALVFVRTSERTFQPLSVAVGEPVGDGVAVTGLAPGSEVVTSGAFLLKTEIMKDSIGAGCCESERPR